MLCFRQVPAAIACALVLVSTASLAQPRHNYAPPNGVVPNEETAVRIAEAVLSPVYGRSLIESERPFHAMLAGDIWTVTGSMHCERLGGGPHSCVGGVAEIDISKHDGRVTRITHGQ